MWHQYKTYDVFNLSVSVCLNIVNFKTVYVREFHSQVRLASSESNPRSLRPLLPCCHVHRVPLDYTVPGTCITFPIVAFLSFIWEPKEITSMLFAAMKTIIQSISNHFQRGRAGG